MASTRVQSDPVQITGAVDMRQHNIVGLETDLSLYPTQDGQGASKKYVDSQRAAIQASLETNIDNGAF